MSYQVESAGGAALRALRAGPARVFASFERSCYVETSGGIACIGASGLGLGPLNAIVKDFRAPSIGDEITADCSHASLWKPAGSIALEFPEIGIPREIEREARAFLAWLRDEGAPCDALIGLGPGLTPAGDDFVGGALIALRASGEDRLAGRIARWALPLAAANTSRISRAHLESAAQGEGHEYLHAFLSTPDKTNLERLARVGHTSGLDAAAGAASAIPCAR